MRGLASAWGRSLLLNLLTGIMWSPMGAELARIRGSQPWNHSTRLKSPIAKGALLVSHDHLKSFLWCHATSSLSPRFTLQMTRACPHGVGLRRARALGPDLDPESSEPEVRCLATVFANVCRLLASLSVQGQEKPLRQDSLAKGQGLDRRRSEHARVRLA